MSALQRIKGWVAKKVMAAIGYEGAVTGRRWNSSTSHGPADTVSLWSLDKLRQRSRHLVRNHWAASRSVDVLAGKIVGKGILPSCRDAEEFDRLLRRWARPQTQVGAQKGQSLAAVQRLACRSIIEGGECLVVRQWRTEDEMKRRGLVMPFQLQVLEPEFLDTWQDGRTENGNEIVGGVEYDSTGWPVAYHIHKRHPASTLRFGESDSVRVDAADVARPFWQLRAGQTVGVPWFAPVLMKIHDFDEYEDAQLMRQKIAAMYAAFVHTGGLGDGSAPSDDEILLEPGLMQWLEPGEEIEFTDPPSVTGYADYTHVTLRSIASGLGLTYESLSGDYSQVNFSSARMGAITSRQLMDQWQTEMMIGILCQSLDQWAREGAELLNIEGANQPCRWTAPRRELLDPSREVGAILRAIDGGLTSRQEEIRRLGRDVNDVDEERQKDMEREEKLGLDSTEDEGEDQQARLQRTIQDTLTEMRMH